MPAKPSTVAQYLAQLSADRRKEVEAILKVIRKNLDKDFEEGIQYGCIGFYVPHSVYPAGYHCNPKEPLPFAGLAVRAPLTTFALAVCVFSLMGFPPTAGFLGKLYVFSSAFSLGYAHPFKGPLIALAIIGVVNSAVAAAYYLRIVASAYPGREVEQAVPSRLSNLF